MQQCQCKLRQYTPIRVVLLHDTKVTPLRAETAELSALRQQHIGWVSCKYSTTAVTSA
jgi:hypothetical protein